MSIRDQLIFAYNGYNSPASSRDKLGGRFYEQNQDMEMTSIRKTREERRAELKHLAAMPNGINQVYWILTQSGISFTKLPIGTLMIEAILEHEYP